MGGLFVCARFKLAGGRAGQAPVLWLKHSMSL